jgi:hypothetical protein
MRGPPVPGRIADEIPDVELRLSLHPSNPSSRLWAGSQNEGPIPVGRQSIISPQGPSATLRRTFASQASGLPPGPTNWVNTVREFARMFKQAAGRASSLARAAPRRSRRWFQGGSLGPFRGMIAPMSQAHAAKTIDGLLDPLSRCLDDESARRVAEFRIDPSIQARIDLLAERANEGLLTDQEGAEYEAFINTADFVSILKLKARRHLTSNGG